MYRSLAPITKNGWEQIDNRAKEVISSIISGRKVVSVTGPKGSNYVAYNHGKLGHVMEQDGVKFASYKVTPLVEIRIEFKLNRWELDNAIRGNNNIDFTNLEDAVRKAAIFEEKAIYEGLSDGNIKGLLELTESYEKLGDTADTIKESIAKAILKLRKAYFTGNMDLIVSEDLYAKLWSLESRTPLVKTLESMIGGKIVTSEVMKGAILIPHKNENFVLELGEDFSLGYQEHDQKEVTFFIKESFTFQVLDESLVVRFE